MSRWKILIIVGLLVAALDQWTKFLAIKHLTPGMAQAAESGDSTSPETTRETTRAHRAPAASLGTISATFHMISEGATDS